VAQGRDHPLVIGDALAVEHRDDDGAGLGLSLDLAEMLQRRHQPRHTDGKSGRRHRLAAKARDQSIVAPAGAYRGETDRSALIVLSLERQIHFEDWAGVVLKAADNGWINADLPKVVCSQRQLGDLSKFIQSMLVDRAVWKSVTSCVNYSDIPRNIRA